MVSGGADSTLLVVVLAELGLEVRALHVAHGLRGADVGRATRRSAGSCAARSA